MSSRPSRGAARLAAILDALPDGLVLVNCNGTVVNANTIALGMFETPGTALVGRGLLDLLPEFDSRLIPGSMRRPEGTDERGRTKPTRMIARRTDGSEFPVEVTSASLEDGREAYDSYGGYTGDELLMLVVRDLTGTLDTEAELARSQRQTEMILRAAAEGVVGTDTDGRVVLVNPAAAQILGYRAGELGGQELHPLILAKRADGEPFPYEESPLADTLKSGRKHRVRGQVLWSKKGERVPVDLTTAPVRDGDQLVGAVMTFTDRRPYEELVEEHAAEIADLTERNAAELADRAERNAAEREVQQERYASLAARHEQLTAVLAESLRGPLEELRTQLGTLAADDAGQLWPEANQVLHHLAAGYARMTALVDNVLGYQRLDAGTEALDKGVVLLDSVVSAGIDGAVELIGPGRAQFAVHAPPIEAEVDAARLATALAHLVADVAGVDATGRNRATAQGSVPADSTIVVAAAQRGDVVRIEVRGPYAGGDPVHGPVVRGVVAAHGGVVQTHEVPGTSGGAYVLEVPLGAGRGTVPPSETPPGTGAGGASGRGGREALALPAQASPQMASPASPQAASPVSPGAAPHGSAAQALPAGSAPAVAPETVSGTGSGAGLVPAAGAFAGEGEETSGGGRRRARRASTDAFLESPVAPEAVAEPRGRRRGRTGDTAGAPGAAGASGVAELIPAQQNSAVESAVAVAGLPAPSAPTGAPVSSTPSVPGASDASVVEPTGRRRGRPAEGAVVTAAEGAQGRAALGAAVPPQGVAVEPSGMPALARALPAVASAEAAPEAQPSGRRRRALAAAQERAAAAEAGPRTPFALPPADADRDEEPIAGPAAGPLPVSDEGQHEAVRGVPGADHTPPQPHPLPHAQPQGPVPAAEPTGRRRAVTPPPPPETPGAGGTTTGTATATATGTGSVPLPPELPMSRPQPQPVPQSQDSTQGRAFSVRTLGQGVPFVPPAPAAAPVVAPAPAAPAVPPAPGAPSNGSGRRRRLATPPEVDPPVPAALPVPAAGDARPHPQGPAAEAALGLAPAAPEGRAYAIGAPAEGSAEGPEPLDGPGGAVEVANRPAPRPVDDELPPEPLDNPRRLLVWPAPDVSTQQALSDRGYRPVIVHSREEVDAQIAAFPAALFVDPLTGPITRTALQSLRRAAVAAEVPVLLAAGLGQATREAAYGADPAVLLKALAPRDSEQHPSRVLLIEENEDIAEALAATLERRGMQVARAATDTEAVTLATRTQPNLVVMDLMQVRRRRAGIIDWLRANGQLNRTPLVVYTSADLVDEELPKLSSGETVLFLAERANSAEVQARIVDLLAKIGTN
ncbi:MULTISPECIES: PAS domain-containing protein [unclassified Streptomyces]|uniref:PAS domain-containing protein n=1 Tax=unclassified Streptomyces TaxID=2593676 RepID=UPI0006F378CA|nr:MULTISPECIES: PAS domain-containing protein [unclassified Streptomyces]KQX49381.1 PAS domain S-box protein [Streptomyces sp. Root1304]KRA78999.1 PAS domain S-box protein [Streptomyces sp. Root66D1]